MNTMTTMTIAMTTVFIGNVIFMKYNYCAIFKKSVKLTHFQKQPDFTCPPAGGAVVTLALIQPSAIPDSLSVREQSTVLYPFGQKHLPVYLI